MIKKLKSSVIKFIQIESSSSIIYVVFNPKSPELNGWGIPMTTDIAFA